MSNGWDVDVSEDIPKIDLDKKEMVGKTVPLTKGDEVQSLINECLESLKQAHERSFNTDKAVKAAASALRATFAVNDFIADADLRARHSKNEIERIEADKYRKYKETATAKITDTALNKMVDSDADVIAAKRAHAEAESEAKNWNNFYNILNNAHIFFRNLAKISG